MRRVGDTATSSTGSKPAARRARLVGAILAFLAAYLCCVQPGAAKEVLRATKLDGSQRFPHVQGQFRLREQAFFTLMDVTVKGLRVRKNRITFLFWLVRPNGNAFYEGGLYADDRGRLDGVRPIEGSKASARRARKIVVTVVPNRRGNEIDERLPFLATHARAPKGKRVATGLFKPGCDPGPE